jgi:uncharacterized protein YkwD
MPIRRSARHRSRRPRWMLALWTVPILAVPILAALVVAGLLLATGTSARSAQSAGPLLATSDCGAPATQAGSASAPCPQPSASSPAARHTPGTPAASHHRHRATHTSRPASPPAHTASPSPAPTATTPAGGQQGSAAAQVLALINQARAQAGLPPYTLSTGLENSSAAHNATMAGGCGLSHQCPGEPALGTRETDAGVHWTSAGENIGEGGPVASADSAIAQMAVGLTQDMLNEKPPDDGHRLNILSSAFQHIGIAVLRDSSGTVWMTQDFSN